MLNVPPGDPLWPRRVFSVWFPYDGTWNTVWDPFGINVLDPPCQYGNGPLDQPFSGFNKDTYPDFRSDMGIFRDDTYGGGATDGAPHGNASTTGRSWATSVRQAGQSAR